MQHILTAYTSKNNYLNAVDDLVVQLNPVQPKLIIFFASIYYEPNTLAKAMEEVFPNTEIIGCSTTGEQCNDQIFNQSIVAMGISQEAIGDFTSGILHNISTSDETKALFEGFENTFSISMLAMNPKEYFGLILFDGGQEKEEKLLTSIGSLTNVTFIGGSAGNENNPKETYVYQNGKAYHDAALVLLCKPNMRFDFIKTQSFDVLKYQMTCTKVDSCQRTVLEFNNMLAITAYSNILGIDPKKADEYFMTYPLSILVYDEPYVRSPLHVEGSGIHFHSNMIEGVTYNLLKSTSIVADSKIAIAEKAMNFGEISGLINFNCIIRYRELVKTSNVDAYGQIFTTIPTIGFNTYGETLIGHMNQTSTMLIFGKMYEDN